MILRNYKVGIYPIIISVVTLLLFYGGIAYSFSLFIAHNPQNISAFPTTLVLHNINLAGVDNAREITHQFDDEDSQSIPQVEQNKIVEKIKNSETRIQAEPIVEVNAQEIRIEETPKDVIATESNDKASHQVQKKKNITASKVPQKNKESTNPPSNNTKRQSKRVQQSSVVGLDSVKVIALPKPIYSDQINRRRIKGTTTILVLMGKNGNAISAKIEKSSGNSSLDEAALKASKNVKIRPYIMDGEATNITLRIPYQKK